MAAAMDLGLKGKTAIVTGASSGLGLASAESFAAEGAQVVMVARRAELLQEEAERIGAVAVPADMTVPESAERVVGETVSRFGGVEILVWNTAGPDPGPATGVDEENLQATFEQVVLP